MRIARLWSVVDDGTVNVERGMTSVDEGERAAFVSYLDSAAVVVASPMTVSDEVNPDSGVGIPVIWYTDGEWIWSAQLSYYLQNYGLVFETELLDHIRSVEFRPPVVADDLREEALRVLLSVGEQG